MTVFDCLKPLTLNAVRNDDRMLRIKFVVVCKSPGGRDTLLTVKCPAPGTHCETNARGLPGGIIIIIIIYNLYRGKAPVTRSDFQGDPLRVKIKYTKAKNIQYN